MRAPVVSVALLVVLLLVPAVSAEFGPESGDGWPVNVHGDELRPPVDPGATFASLLDMPDRHAHDDGPLPALNKVGPVTVFPYYPVLAAEMQRLALDHPDLVRVTSAGTSHAGLPMWLLEIADFENPDMIPLEEREVVYIDGGTHSNEYSGVYFVTELAQFLLDEYETNETAKWIVENRHTWILPMVNPDGSNAFGRLNAMLVNVNRNFPGSFGAVDESFPMNNPGPAPASEPETQAVIGILDRLQPDYVNSIHCCGNLWLHPYGAEDLGDAPDIAMFTRVCDEVFAEVRDDCGPIWSTIYPASGTTADEGYIRVGASSWTYEMSGRGAVAPWGQPAVHTDVRTQERESWDGVVHALLNVHRYGAWPEVRAVVGEADRLGVVVENIGWGDLVGGNISVGSAQAPLPRIAAGETTTVMVTGAFAEGATSVTVDWTKRVWRAPQGEKTLGLELVADGGRLVGAFAGAGPEHAAGAAPVSDAESSPAPIASALVGLIVSIVTIARRRV